MKRLTNINKISALLVALFVATAFSACSDISGTDYDSELSSENFTQSFDKKGNGNGTEQPYGNALDDKGKIYVCKYVSTPGVSERLKKGNKGLVHVSANSQRNNLPKFPLVEVGDTWQDKHFTSTVIPHELGAFALQNGDFPEDFCLSIGLGGDGGNED